MFWRTTCSVKSRRANEQTWTCSFNTDGQTYAHICKYTSGSLALHAHLSSLSHTHKQENAADKLTHHDTETCR